MKKTLFMPSVAILAMCLAMTSCSQAVTEEAGSASLPEESVTETTVEPFDPILITEDYDGPILGIENWHIEDTAYYHLFINDDTGEEFASCTGSELYYLADLNNDGEPELVVVEKWGSPNNTYTMIFKLEDGVISSATPCEGSEYAGPCYYPELADAYDLKINQSNYKYYSDTFDPERNMIIVTDSSTGNEYEFAWEYMVFFTQEEKDAVIEELMGGTNAEPADKTSDTIGISYSTAEPVITDISDTVKEITFYRDDMEIEGKLYLPEGDGPFPVIILCCGLMQPYSDYEADAQGFADNGYAAVVFSFIGYSDPNGENPTNYGEVFLSETRDLYAVMDSLEYLPEVDSDCAYLWGHSFGGLVTAFAGCDRTSEVMGLILVEPAIIYGEELAVTYEDGFTETLRIYSLLKTCELDTVIYMGTHDGFGDDPTSFDQVLEVMPSAELVIIDGADHFFEGEYGQQMVEDACEKITSWS